MIENKISFIVPCHKLFKRVVDEKYEVEACIDSILDQDYDEYEIIVVANGPDRKAIMDFVGGKYGSRVVLAESEPANAAIARNLGAAMSTGEFRSYFSCDLTLYPGIARLWVKTFKKNPQVSIVYSEGIDWVEGGKPLDFRAQTTQYDEYQITSQNLIDGANPVRACDDQPWDDDVKALQDWNWALKVLKPLTPEAKKALMIKEIFYTTEKPKDGGLSDYFSKHWLELNKQIKEKRGLPNRSMCVSSLGAPFHGLRTARLLDADFNQMPSMHEHEYDVVYLMGYYISNMVMHNRVFNGMKRSALKVIHWIGTDVLQLMNMPWLSERNLAQGLREYIDLHLCESKVVQQELAELGIPASVAPLPLNLVDYPMYTEVPEQYTCAIYTPHWDEENIRKYNLMLMLDIVRAMPDFKFILFGSKTGYPDKLPENVETRSWVPIQEVAKDANVLLRFPFHDGLPVSACEFIVMNRDVVCSTPMVGAYYAGSGMLDSSKGGPDYDQAKANIIQQLRNVKSNPRVDRSEAINYWKENLNPEFFKKTVNDLIEKRKVEVMDQLKKAVEDAKD